MEKKTVNKKILQILTSVAQNLQRQNLIKSQAKILVTFSGGQDSICLLIIFFILRRQLLINFDLLYCHHFWQKSSFFTLLHVARCNFSCSTTSMFFFSLKPSLSEKIARDWRHKVIQRAIVFYGYKTVTQAHTKSDRIETILFNLIRGTGLRGAATLQFQSNQSLYSYNKFYSSRLLVTNFLECFQYTRINAVKETNLIFFNTLYITSQDLQNRQVRLQKVLGLYARLTKENQTTKLSSFCKQNDDFAEQSNNKKDVKLYSVNPEKQSLLTPHQNCSLLEAASLPSEVGKTVLHHSVHIYSATINDAKVKAKRNFQTFTHKVRKAKLLQLFYRVEQQQINLRSCRRKNDAKPDGKTNKFYFVKQVSIFQSVPNNCFYFNLRRNVKLKSKIFNMVKPTSKTKSYKFCYKQLKQLIDLRMSSKLS